MTGRTVSDSIGFRSVKYHEQTGRVVVPPASRRNVFFVDLSVFFKLDYRVANSAATRYDLFHHAEVCLVDLFVLAILVFFQHGFRAALDGLNAIGLVDVNNLDVVSHGRRMALQPLLEVLRHAQLVDVVHFPRSHDDTVLPVQDETAEISDIFEITFFA